MRVSNVDVRKLQRLIEIQYRGPVKTCRYWTFATHKEENQSGLGCLKMIYNFAVNQQPSRDSGIRLGLGIAGGKKLKFKCS